MSFMESDTVFCDNVRELSLAEVDAVSGGPLPLIPIAYAGIALSVGVLAIGYSWVGGVHAGYNINLK